MGPQDWEVPAPCYPGVTSSVFKDLACAHPGTTVAYWFAIMKNRNLSIVLFALTGLAAPAVADVRAPVVVEAIHSSPTDFAPITTPDTANQKPGRLRRTDQEQPGNEMSHLAFFTDATTGKVVT